MRSCFLVGIPASQVMCRASAAPGRADSDVASRTDREVLRSSTDSPLPAVGLPVGVPGPLPPPGRAPDAWPVLLPGALTGPPVALHWMSLPGSSSSGSSGPPGNPPHGPTQPQLEDPSHDARGTSGYRRLLTDPHFPWYTSTPQPQCCGRAGCSASTIGWAVRGCHSVSCRLGPGTADTASTR